MFSSGVNDGSLRPLIIHLLPSPHKLFITERHLTVQWTRQSGSDSRRRTVRHRKNIKNPIIVIVIIIIVVVISTGLPAIGRITSCGVRVAKVESSSCRNCSTVMFAKIKKLCFEIVASCWAFGVIPVCELYFCKKASRRKNKSYCFFVSLTNIISLNREDYNVLYEEWVRQTKASQVIFDPLHWPFPLTLTCLCSI